MYTFVLGIVTGWCMGEPRGYVECLHYYNDGESCGYSQGERAAKQYLSNFVSTSSDL